MGSYFGFFGVTDKARSVEVERVAAAQLTIDHLPLLVQPALGSILAALQNNVIALQSAGKVVPGCCHESVLSLEIFDLLFRGGLMSHKFVSYDHERG